MRLKTIHLPFLSRSGLNDFMSADGEIASADGVTLTEQPMGNSNNSGNTDNRDNESGDPLEYTVNPQVSRPPSPDITFTLVRSVLPGWHLMPDLYPTRTMSCTNPSPEAWRKVAEETLSSFLYETDSANLFSGAVLVTAAWRMTEGGYMSPSLPVLLTAGSRMPAVTAGDELTEAEMDMRVAAAVCEMRYKIAAPEILRDWVGKVASLDIFVSEPLTEYDSTKRASYSSRMVYDSFCHCLDTKTGVATERRICSDTLNRVWTVKEIRKNPGEIKEFHRFASIPLAEVMTMTEFRSLERYFCRDGFRYRPSYLQLSLRGADGGIRFKGRMLLWNPYILYPAYAPLDKAMTYTTDNTPPRFLYHPDPMANEYQYSDENGLRKSVYLERHNEFYGAYYWGGLETVKPEPGTAYSVKTGERERKADGCIMISEPGETPVWEDCGLTDTGCGRIAGLCRAFRASGLVATTNPTLYVFTETGVYLFKIDAKGVPGEAGLLTRYVIGDISSLRLLSKGILFTTADGETVMIEGTKITSVALNDSSGGNSTGPQTYITIEGNDKTFEVETRPMKFLTKVTGIESIYGRFVRLIRLYLRGNFDPGTLTVKVYGSRDLKQWLIIGKREGGAAVSVPGSLFRFYKVGFSGYLTSGSTIEGMSLIFKT